MNTTIPMPDPPPEDIQGGLARIEQYVAAQAPAADVESVEQPVDGETRRVRALRAQVAEAHRLAALQDDDTPLLVDTPKVRKRRMKAAEAARLHQLAQDPMMRAWRADRMRRLFTAVAVVALFIALGWSTAGVQEFAAEDAVPGSPRWWFAWCVEPFVSLALLFVVGARAYLATQGQPIKNSTLDRIEWLFLALSLGMNAWPYTPWVAQEFVFSRLALHTLGPIVAVAIVMALPIILKGFGDLDHHRVTHPLTGPAYRENTPAGAADSNPSAGPDLIALVARTRGLIAAGDLPAEPSARAIREALRCGMDSARAVRDALRGELA